MSNNPEVPVNPTYSAIRTRVIHRNSSRETSLKMIFTYNAGSSFIKVRFAHRPHHHAIRVVASPLSVLPRDEFERDVRLYVSSMTDSALVSAMRHATLNQPTSVTYNG